MASEELNELGWCVCNCENKSITLIASHDDICELSLANNDCFERLKRVGVCPSCQQAGIPSEDWESRALLGDNDVNVVEKADAIGKFDWAADGRELKSNEARVNSIDELKQALSAGTNSNSSNSTSNGDTIIDTLFVGLKEESGICWIEDIAEELKRNDKLLSKIKAISFDKFKLSFVFADALVTILRAIPKLQRLKITHNPLSNTGFDEVLCRVISNMSSLQELVLRTLNVSDEALARLALAIKELPNLRYIDFSAIHKADQEWELDEDEKAQLSENSTKLLLEAIPATTLELCIADLPVTAEQLEALRQHNHTLKINQ